MFLFIKEFAMRGSRIFFSEEGERLVQFGGEGGLLHIFGNFIT